DLYREVLEPWLIYTIGEEEYRSPRRSTLSSTSFGYVLPMRNGLPLFLRIGRGDRADVPSGWSPGEHTLQVNVNLIWALHRLRAEGGVPYDDRLDDLWRIIAKLIDEVGYRIKGMGPRRGLTSSEVYEAFRRRVLRTDELILERVR